jgi:hypothetical protein
VAMNVLLLRLWWHVEKLGFLGVSCRAWRVGLDVLVYPAPVGCRREEWRVSVRAVDAITVGVVVYAGMV